MRTVPTQVSLHIRHVWADNRDPDKTSPIQKRILIFAVPLCTESPV